MKKVLKQKIAKETKIQGANGGASSCVSTLAEIAEKALKLPPGEQLKLARALLEGCEAIRDPDADDAWEAGDRAADTDD